MSRIFLQKGQKLTRYHVMASKKHWSKGKIVLCMFIGNRSLRPKTISATKIIEGHRAIVPLYGGSSVMWGVSDNTWVWQSFPTWRPLAFRSQDMSSKSWVAEMVFGRSDLKAYICQSKTTFFTSFCKSLTLMNWAEILNINSWHPYALPKKSPAWSVEVRATVTP